jgi:hypothetical protein
LGPCDTILTLATKTINNFIFAVWQVTKKWEHEKVMMAVAIESILWNRFKRKRFCQLGGD